MGLYVGAKEALAVHAGALDALAVYRGAELVWSPPSSGPLLGEAVGWWDARAAENDRFTDLSGNGRDLVFGADAARPAWGPMLGDGYILQPNPVQPGFANVVQYQSTPADTVAEDVEIDFTVVRMPGVFPAPVLTTGRNTGPATGVICVELDSDDGTVRAHIHSASGELYCTIAQAVPDYFTPVPLSVRVIGDQMTLHQGERVSNSVTIPGRPVFDMTQLAANGRHAVAIPVAIGEFEVRIGGVPYLTLDLANMNADQTAVTNPGSKGGQFTVGREPTGLKTAIVDRSLVVFGGAQTATSGLVLPATGTRVRYRRSHDPYVEGVVESVHDGSAPTLSGITEEVIADAIFDRVLTTDEVAQVGQEMADGVIVPYPPRSDATNSCQGPDGTAVDVANSAGGGTPWHLANNWTYEDWGMACAPVSQISIFQWDALAEDDPQLPTPATLDSQQSVGFWFRVDTLASARIHDMRNSSNNVTYGAVELRSNGALRVLAGTTSIPESESPPLVLGRRYWVTHGLDNSAAGSHRLLIQNPDGSVVHDWSGQLTGTGDDIGFRRFGKVITSAAGLWFSTVKASSGVSDGLPLFVKPTVVNLLTRNQATGGDIFGDTTGFVATGAVTAAYSTAHARQGPGSIEATSTGNGSVYADIPPNTVPGAGNYTAQVDVFCEVERTVIVSLFNTWAGTVTTITKTIEAGVWTTFRDHDRAWPSSWVNQPGRIIVNVATAGAPVYCDNFGLWAGDGTEWAPPA